MSNALGKTLCVRNEEVVAYELNLISEYFRHMFPTFPVFFIQAVFNGINRIFFDQGFPVVDQFFGCIFLTAFRQDVFACFTTLPFAGCGINSQNEIFTRCIARFFYGSKNILDSVFIACQVGSKAAFITDGSSQTLFFQQGCQGMEYFCAPTQAFTEGRGTGRHNHKFLHVYRIGCVSTAVQNIHHRNGQAISANAADVAI